MKNSLSALDFFCAKIAYEITPEDLATAQAMGASPIVVAVSYTHLTLPTNREV